jgi:hypothetical protein
MRRCLPLLFAGSLLLRAPVPALGMRAKTDKPQKHTRTPYVTGHFRSPDNQYRVTIVHDDGDIDDITVEEVRTGKKLVEAINVDGFRWAPRSPHRLVVAASGLYGTAMLAMWEGGTRWRDLVRVRDPNNEGFTLLGVSRDGRFITYEHSRNVAGDLDRVAETAHHHRLRLPK